MMSSAIVVPYSHLKSMKVDHLGVFEDELFEFSPHLNLIIGENGTGKSQLLKLAYSAMAASVEGHRKYGDQEPTKQSLQSECADKIMAVFKPETLGHLVNTNLHRKFMLNKAGELSVEFFEPSLNFAVSIKAGSKNSVSVQSVPQRWLNRPPVFIPTRELLTLYPGFFSVYESRYLEFEETYRDLCLLLGLPLLKNINPEFAKLLTDLENLMGARVVLDKNGRFYLNYTASNKTLEMPLVAEGTRKIAMIAQLLANGSFQKEVSLFWDEPETNLNPKMLKYVARLIYALSANGVQVFIATHSLFLMRELEIIHEGFSKQSSLYIRVFCLEAKDENVKVHQSSSFSDMEVIVSLDEELIQSERFMEAMDA